jgi:hypothetical protein
MVRPFGAACTSGGINTASRAASNGPRAVAAAAYIYVFIAVKQPLLGLRNVNCKSDGVA